MVACNTGRLLWYVLLYPVWCVSCTRHLDVLCTQLRKLQQLDVACDVNIAFQQMCRDDTAIRDSHKIQHASLWYWIQTTMVACNTGRLLCYVLLYPVWSVSCTRHLDVLCTQLRKLQQLDVACDVNIAFQQMCRDDTAIRVCVSSPGYTWDADTDMYYRIESQEQKNWADAERTCAISQGHLIRPDTASKKDKLGELLNQFSFEASWIGARYEDGAKEWQWLDNNTITSPPWFPGEPSGDGSCIDLLRHQQYKWNDESCDTEAYYVCEIRLN
ncbi:C-type lectin domain family 4 member M-like isoform X2 [Haliotis cracherodii]